MAKVDLPKYVTVRSGGYFYFRVKRDGQDVKVERGGKMVLPRLPHPLDPKFREEYERVHRELLGFYPEDAKTREGSIEDLANQFERWVETNEPDLAKNSVNIIKRSCEILRVELGEFRAKAATTQVMQALYDKLDIPVSSRNRIFDVISRTFSWGMPRGLTEANPCAGIERMKTDGHLEPWPMEDLMTLIKGGREAIVSVALMAVYTGQDRGDVLALCDREIDGEVWNLRRKKTRKKIIERNPVTLHTVALAIIEECREKKRERSIVDPNRPLLTDDDGEPWTAEKFNSAWKKEMGRLGLRGRAPRLTFKGLRHTNATMIAQAAAAAGGGRHAVLERVKDMLGHHSQKMSEIYAKRAAQQVTNSESAGMLPDLTRTKGEQE